MTRRIETVLDAMSSPHLFARWFRDEGTWSAWRVFLSALFALPMDDRALALYQQCTGRPEPPADPSCEAWVVVGRRGGKSFILALVAVFLATFRDWRPFLQPGERATVMVIAADRKQARVIMRYIRALVLEVPTLRKHYFVSETKESIDLTVPVTIEVHTASFRTVRGYTIVAALLDEIAFWPTDDSANPDTEILNAIRPAGATIPGAMLLCASSPYARRGALWKSYRTHFGKDSRVLVWRADTRTMNPTVPEALIAEAYEDDPGSAAAEYGAQFRCDVESFISREAVEACVVPGRHELPPVHGVTYHAFTDPSGGSSDSMTLCVAHAEQERIVIDALREQKPKFNPESVVNEFAALLKRYRIGQVVGDRYGAEWVASTFRKAGMYYRPAEKPKSDLYVSLLPALNSGQVELLDDDRSVNQICGLERRTARGGRDSIDHGPNAHDDLANALAGAVSLAARPVARPAIRFL